MNGNPAHNKLALEEPCLTASVHRTLGRAFFVEAEVEKRCTECGEMKAVAGFSKNKNSKDGLSWSCKVCARNRVEEWRKANLERSRESAKRYRAANPEKVKKATREWCKNNPEKVSEYQRRYYRKQISKPGGRINDRMATAVYRVLKDKKAGQPWELWVGYTTADLMKHLEKQFQPGMSWENYGEWHIDHIIPVSAFNYKTAEDIDFKRCWALKNLRPLWAKDNIRKGAKLDKPFQPSLAFSEGAF